ncbi:MAG: zinc-binding dehydrogenase [Micromonosporaceae bacterium]|nr:zinc-binding dehydrogenase [Micromonosporaceae bacterium]
MHAITIPSPGGPEVLSWDEVPDPVPQPGEVVVDVAATAVNRADLLQRQGFYPPPPGAPPYPGLECSGRVAELGRDVTGWRVSDEVCALLSGGGYATRVAVPAGQLLPIPASVSLVDATALPEVACTVWSNVYGIAALRPGEALLVHGAGSGIGTFAIQLARATGARVLGTARAAKHDALRALGADVLIDYSTEDFVAASREATDGRGVDVVLDIIGGAYLARNIEALAPGGRIVIIGLQGGRKAELNLGALMGKRGTVSATTLRARLVEEKAAIVRAVRDHVWPLIESGDVRPVIDRTLPITDAAEAHRIVDASEHIGKVLLTVTAAE